MERSPSRAWLACVPALGAKLPGCKLAPVGFDWHEGWRGLRNWYLPKTISHPSFLPSAFLQTSHRHHQLQSLLLCYSHSFDQFSGSALQTHSFCESLSFPSTPLSLSQTVASQAQAQAQAHTARIAHDTLYSPIPASLGVQFSFGHSFKARINKHR